jgi:hypothetical protein
MPKTEKRIHPRKKYLKPVQYEIGAPMRKIEAVDAELLDISAGGACIMTDRAYRRGKVVRLRLPLNGTDILVPSLAKVRWVSPTDGRFKMGLKFFM